MNRTQRQPMRRPNMQRRPHMQRRPQVRIQEYSNNVSGNIQESFGYVYGMFIPCLIIAIMINPYHWKMYMDGKVSWSIYYLIINSFFFALATAIFVTVPAYFYGFNYKDVDCYPEFPSWQFWNWSFWPWNWSKTDKACEIRRKPFYNMVTVVGVMVVVAYYLYHYRTMYGNLAFPFMKNAKAAI